MSTVEPQMAPGPLWAWMTERHAIYVRKSIREGIDPGRIHATRGADLEEADPDHFAMQPEGPLTHDPVLRDWRFCNVFRELDTVTIWIKQNIRYRFAEHPHLWLMLAIARTINWPPTLRELIDTPGCWPSHESFSPVAMAKQMETRAARGDKVYTGAYMIRAESNRAAPWYSWSKHRYIAGIVIGRLWRDRLAWLDLVEPLHRPVTGSALLEEVWAAFQDPEYIGWGPFMAYEVVTDLRHTRFLRDAPDKYSWANAGPGALKGLNRLQGKDPRKGMTQHEANRLMLELLGLARYRKWPDWFPSRDLEMRDIEHSLCELDKWLRVKRGEGFPRSKYHPGRGS